MCTWSKIFIIFSFCQKSKSLIYFAVRILMNKIFPEENYCHAKQDNASTTSAETPQDLHKHCCHLLFFNLSSIHVNYLFFKYLYQSGNLPSMLISQMKLKITSQLRTSDTTNASSFCKAITMAMELQQTRQARLTKMIQSSTFSGITNLLLPKVSARPAIKPTVPIKMERTE